VKPAPDHFDTRRAQQLIDAAAGHSAVPSRIDRISGALVGVPYRCNTLIGSAEQPEVFTIDLETYDCVTFMETVLALAQSRSAPAVPETLRNLRYKSGKVDWQRRNHYMTQWIRNNLKTGAVRRIAKLRATRHKDRILNVVPGLPSRRARFDCIPKATLLKSRDVLRTGDFVFMASTRSHLDVFHCGIIIKNGADLIMRHASRSRGAVVNQKLSEFFQQNRMAGVLVVRPAEIP
jgi:hypothetical protein